MKTPPLVRSFSCGPLATNTILLACPRTLKAAVVDPAAGSLEHLQEAANESGVQVEKILLTHSHWDHIVDVTRVKRAFGVPVLVHALDAANLESPGNDGLPVFIEGGIEGVVADGFLEDGAVVAVGALELQVIHVPGHCPGSVCFYLEREGVLIAGDLIFRGSIGTLALPTAEPEKMWKSLDRIGQLPGETQVYPGHGEPTTLADEGWLANAKELFGY